MKRKLKVLLVGLLFLMAFVGIVSAATQVDTTTEHILPADPPSDISPAHPCQDLGYVDFKEAVGTWSVPLADGEYCDTSDPKRCVTINFYVIDSAGNWVEDTYTGTGSRENAFDFSGANFDIEQVIVHGGNLGSNIYDYRTTSGGPGPVRADTRLTAPLMTNNQGVQSYPGLSVIDFCGGPAVPEFPTLALPVGMMIGIVGLVYFVKKRQN